METLVLITADARSKNCKRVRFLAYRAETLKRQLWDGSRMIVNLRQFNMLIGLSRDKI